MLTLEPMVKVRAVCLHGKVERVVSAMYEFGDIQVTRSRYGTPDVPLPSFKPISEELIALRSMESILKISANPPSRIPPDMHGLIAMSKALRSEFEKVRQAVDAIDSLKQHEALAQLDVQKLEPFRNLRVSPSSLKNTGKLSFEYGLLKVSEKELLSVLKGMPAEVSFARSPGKAYALVAYAKGNAECAEALQRAFLQKFEFPQVEEKNFSAAYQRAVDDCAVVAKEGGKLEAIVDSFTKKNSSELVRVRADLEEHAKQAEITNKFGKSEFLEVVEGWVPQKEYPELEKMLYKAAGGKVFVEKAETQEKTPSKFSNPSGVRRFEFLVSSFSIPDSHELDPTLFIAVSFPLIFGMIFGDIGYGIITALMGGYMRFKGSGFMRDAGGMMALSGLSTILFGFVYGEFFGGEKMLGFTLTPIIHRAGEGIGLLLGLTLVVGILHVALGFLLGVVTNLRARHYSHAWAKLTWILVEFAMVAACYSIVFKQSWLLPPSVAVLVVGVAGVYKFEGVQGIFELPTLLSSCLSYLRIMALGLSGVIISLMVNQIPLDSAFAGLASSFNSPSGFDPVTFAVSLLTVVLFAGALVIGHGLALALGIFESGLQTLRLHYVEFFSKFYKGGGLPFLPLREKLQ